MKKPPTHTIVCLVLPALMLWLFSGSPSYAHDDPNASVPEVHAFYTDSPIIVDGALDEPFWQQAEVSGEFIAPFNNTRTDMGISLFESDFWRSLDMAWAFGTFEEVNYDELTLGKRFKPMERWPIRTEKSI